MSCILHKISWTQCRPLSSMFINSSPIWPNLQMQPFGCFSSQSFVAKCQTSKRGTVTSQASVLLHIFPTQLSTKLCGCASHFSTAQSLFKSENEDKPGIVAKYKQLGRDYWYVLLPVHATNSLIWFTSFYILCKSGIDMTSLLTSCGVSETYLAKLASSEWSYLALATACYKLVSPIRYTLTVAVSTLAIKYLKDWGYLKTSGEFARGLRNKMLKIKSKLSGDKL